MLYIWIVLALIVGAYLGFLMTFAFLVWFSRHGWGFNPATVQMEKREETPER